MVDDSLVTHVQVQEGLDPVVLLVKEVDLVLQLLHVALISLLLVLLGKLVHVLTTLVELAEAKDLGVADLDSAIQVAKFLLEGQMLLDEVLVFVAELVGALVSPSKLLRPLLILDGHAAVLGVSLRAVHALIALTVHLVAHAGAAGCQLLAELEALGGATQHVVDLTV